jgi:hypothetical protein
MKGILQTALLFYLGGRLQILLVVLALLQLLVTPWLSSGGDIFCRAPGLPPSSFLVAANFACLLIMGALTFRAVSSQRSLAFIPYARIRIVMGVLLAELVGATLVASNAALVHLRDPCVPLAWGSVSHTFVGSLAVMTLWILWSFFVVGPTAWLRWTLVILVFICGPVLYVYIQSDSRFHGVDALDGFGLSALVAASLFGVWYLRARYIAPPMPGTTDLGSVDFRRSRVQPDRSGAASRAEAVNAYLIGKPSILRACWPYVAVITVANIVPAFIFQKWFSGTMRVDVGLMSTMVFLSAGGSYATTNIARRARALWIRGGYSRRELFRTAERLSLSSLAYTGGPLVVLALLEWGGSLLGDTQRYLMLLMLTTAFCNLYLMLMDFRRVWFGTGFAVFFGLTWLILMPHAIFFPFTWMGPWGIVIPGAEVVLAIVLRAVALYRWERIDWLVYQLPRQSSQALRTA